MTKSSRESDSRDVHRLDLEPPRDIRGVCVVAENAPAYCEVHVGTVRTSDLDAPSSLLADDAVHRETPHIVLVCEQQSNLCARAVGTTGNRIPGAPDREVA